MEARFGSYARAQIFDETVAPRMAGVVVQTARADHGVPAVDDQQFRVQRHPFRVARGREREGEVALETRARAVLARKLILQPGHLGLELAHVRDPRVADDVVCGHVRTVYHKLAPEGQQPAVNNSFWFILAPGVPV